ncbi:hypothetical protein N7449_005156 [Penicillium cf. viridicatum]|uniref:MARVEL domain-containing protein n=1 Tax=Penicillium cf. viridicatum TaxID=2972119 RepID=A0A9W9MKY8_9EURO|nr:hypothetical protein N7449_005156 [Penicillium cf. viridicatum]
MAPPGVFFSLRLSQAIYAVATFALLSVAAHSYFTSFEKVPWEITLALFSSFLSLIAVAYLAFRSLSPSKALSKPFSFAVYWLVSFVSLAAFICLAKLLAGANECEGALCTVTKIATAVVFLSYAVWVTATTLIGIEISKDNGRAGEVSQEKLTALSND